MIESKVITAPAGKEVNQKMAKASAEGWKAVGISSATIGNKHFSELLVSILLEKEEV